MRIVIDFQGAQAENRFRGIGRYTMSLTQAIVRNRAEHEIILGLNDMFPETIEPIRDAFDGLISQNNIRVFHVPGPVCACDPKNDGRRAAAEIIREAFLASLHPDVIHINSLFEGYRDDAVTSIGRFDRSTPVSVTLHDLIPFLHPDHYLKSNPNFARYYYRKIEDLKRAAIWLSVSESSKQEGIVYLGLPASSIINTLEAAEPHFRILQISPAKEEILRKKYGLNKAFVLYTGGIDYRKNIEGLICAFARLPEELGRHHQLAIVCSVSDKDKHRLKDLVKERGLAEEDFVLTDFVPEDELVMLYNLCKLYVFPSWHEGFGLPALEAMQCGAPVIGADTSSVPEVIGWEDALFDPHSEEAIAAKMEQALTDIAFRTELIQNGNKQSELFSWDNSARRAIDALERFHEKRNGVVQPQKVTVRRPKMAYVSPLPPEKSGIADYSAELLPELAKFYEIDVIVVQDVISNVWIKKNCSVRSVQWFVDNFDRYERVVYHFGNSIYHEHMFELLKTNPGVVVLHDFFLSGILAHKDYYQVDSRYWTKELYKSHGYKALKERFYTGDLVEVIWKYPCSLGVIQKSLGVIVHSPNSLKLAKQWYGADLSDWELIPLLRNPAIGKNKIKARKELNFKFDDFLACSFGIMGSHKLNHRLLQAWLKSSLSQEKNCYLIFVGENNSDEYGQKLLRTIRRSRASKNIRIIGWTEMNVFRQYLAAADVGVQLRTLSRGETSAAVLDCMNYGLATIVNANGSMADIENEAVWQLPDEFTNKQLIEALETLRQDKNLRLQIGEAARKIIHFNHNPRSCAEQYKKAIERFYRSSAYNLQALPNAIARIDTKKFDDTALIKIADAIARSIPPRNRQPQLLVDVSEIVQRDVRSGIQRVVRSIISEWLNNPPVGYRIEPVYATVDQGYRYARCFTLKFLECPVEILHDEPIEYFPGDIFFGLDLQPQVVPAYQNFFQELRRHGIKVYFAVYDLLCVQMPQYFYDGAAEEFNRWIEVITENDGGICISKAVAGQLADRLKEHGLARQRPFRIDWFHLGADVENSEPTKGLPNDAESVLISLRNRKSFLMVGTLEPRKGHVQVLDAFEKLWQTGIDVNLIIVGQQGWMVEKLVERLRLHGQMNKRLFWFESISDEYLDKIYTTCTCLIAASYGEGFGLPLIEAAKYKLPIIARDIPVFREVAGEYAFYFCVDNALELMKVIKEWLMLYKKQRVPLSDKMPFLTWKQSANQLMEICIRKKDNYE